MTLSFPAVKDAALYGLNVAFVQQPKGAIARYSAHLARGVYLASVVVYAALSFKKAYRTYKANKEVDPWNSRVADAHSNQVKQRADDIEQNKGSSTFQIPEEVAKPALRVKNAYALALSYDIGKAVLGFGLWKGVTAIPSQAINLKDQLGL